MLVSLSVALMKQTVQAQLGEEKFFSAHTSRSQSLLREFGQKLEVGVEARIVEKCCQLA